MSELRLSFPTRFLAGKSRMSAGDVSILRKISFPDGIRTSDDAALLLAIHHACPETCDEWHGFFIEALTDFIVHQTYPQGSLDDINVAWLIQVLSGDGIVHSSTEFEVLMHVIDVSAHIPPALSAFALDQLHHALNDGTGAYREARSLDHRGITRHDLEFIQHVLGTATDASDMALSPIEIAALRRIDRATASHANHPGWADLQNAIGQPPASNPRTRWLVLSDDIFRDVENAA